MYDSLNLYADFTDIPTCNTTQSLQCNITLFCCLIKVYIIQQNILVVASEYKGERLAREIGHFPFHNYHIQFMLW